MCSSQLESFLSYHLKVPDILEALLETLPGRPSHSLRQIFEAFESKEFTLRLPARQLDPSQRVTNNRLTRDNLANVQACLLVFALGLKTAEELSRLLVACYLEEMEMGIAGIPAIKDTINRLLKQVDLAINPRCIEEFLARSKDLFKTTESYKKRFIAGFEVWEQWKQREAHINGNKAAEKTAKIDFVLTIDEFIFLAANAESRSKLLAKLPPYMPKRSMSNEPSSDMTSFPVDKDSYIREQYLNRNKGLQLEFIGQQKPAIQVKEKRDKRDAVKSVMRHKNNSKK